MESFYGGRQGASIIIKRRFDDISFNNEKVYKRLVVAVTYKRNENDELISEIIKDESGKAIIKNELNWNNSDYVWEIRDCDGSIPGYEIQYAESMEECFKQGGDTVQDVAYGEYVLIDTVTNLHEESNLHNGRLYRRGMNFSGELGGAEYIGQILGPKGNAPTLSIDSLDEDIPWTKGSYVVKQRDLIPGKEIANNIVTYHDVIDYGWYTVRDTFGNVVGTKIGFQIPYTVFAFEARSREPYTDAGSSTDFDKVELIHQIYDDEEPHPFYNSYHIDVPKGYKGDSIERLMLSEDGLLTYAVRNYEIYAEGSVEGHDKLYANELNNDGTIKPIQWVNSVTTGPENEIGQVIFNYNTGKTVSKIIHSIKDILFSDGISQKYINNTTVVPSGHLLISFSNSEYALKNIFTDSIEQIKDIYKDKICEDENNNKWLDLGRVKGEPGSFLTAKVFETEADFIAAINRTGESGHAELGPEMVMSLDGQSPNNDYVGWAVAVGLDDDAKYWNYDYTTRTWFCVGGIGAIVSTTYFSDTKDITQYIQKGQWFRTEDANYIE